MSVWNGPYLTSLKCSQPCCVSGTVMCFGQTGAGKTFTMTGSTESYKERGIIPRALQEVTLFFEWCQPLKHLECITAKTWTSTLNLQHGVQVFQEVEKRTEHSFSVHLSYLEIYNESMVDLLAPLQGSSQQPPQSMLVMEEPGRGVFIRGLTLHPVHSEEDALNLLFEVWDFVFTAVKHLSAWAMRFMA